MPQANLNPVMRPYDPSTVPSPSPEQQERLARARASAVSGYASDGVLNSKPAFAAAALAAGIVAPELLAPAAAALDETAAGAAFGVAGRAAAGAAGGAVRAAAGFVGQAARAFLDSSGAAARSAAGAIADPARFGEAAAEFTRSAFVDKAKDAVVIGAAAELANRAGSALHGWLGHRHHHHEPAPAPPAPPPSASQDR
jgi:hypothetical protein